MWLNRAEELGRHINERLWNEQAGAYMDRDRTTREFNGVLSPASFMPLYVKVPTKERAAPWPPWPPTRRSSSPACLRSVTTIPNTAATTTARGPHLAQRSLLRPEKA